MNDRITAVRDWFDARFPVTKFWQEHLSRYYAPKNLNFWYFFGSLAMLMLGVQLITGIFLTMNYKPTASTAFASVEYIMRDVEWGWLIRYIHANGASFFFIVIYLHMFRGLLYGSYKQPRELLWVFGMFLFVALMAEAFMGYLLPWGQMSYWGAQVIISLFGAIPYIGDDLALWIRGDYVVADATLNRFFSFHVIAIPLILLALIVFHLISLHSVGSNNPDGIEIKKKKDAKGIPLDGIPFHPYYTIKDTMGVIAFLFIFAVVIFYNPEMNGWFLEHDNFIPANPLKTPQHIEPLWYFTPFYAILRAIPDKFLGVMAMGLSILMLFLLPWLDRSPVRSIRYKGPMFKSALVLFIISFLGLAFIGTVPPTPTATVFSRIFTVVYFAFFLLMPIYSRKDKTKIPPERVTYKK
jgi:ubiquinol-cytochrome c reductase cytochrome b subunit